MKSIDYFALCFALAGTMCLVSKGYDNYQWNKNRNNVVESVKIDESYIVKSMQRQAKKKIALAKIQRIKSIQSCKKDYSCKVMAQAIYFEARGESKKGQISVGQVILERTKRKGFPNTVYGVVHQKSSNGVCHFSYVCDIESGRLSSYVLDGYSFNNALEYAAGVMAHQYPRYVGKADHYYNPKKVKEKPYWVSSMSVVGSVGSHLFLDSRIK